LNYFHLVLNTKICFQRVSEPQKVGIPKEETRSESFNNNYPIDENSHDYDTLDSPPLSNVVPRTGRKSVTSDLFQQWLSLPPMSPGNAFLLTFE